MKKPYLTFPLALLLLISTGSFAQEVIHQQSCSNDMNSKEVDSLKDMYSHDGYILLKEASITMESEYEMPVVIPLTQGSWYQFIFIGDYTSKLYEVRMYDWNERQVIFRQKKWGDVDGNIISYSYVPQFSEFHMMKPRIQRLVETQKRTINTFLNDAKKNIEAGKTGPQEGGLALLRAHRGLPVILCRALDDVRSPCTNLCYVRVGLGRRG